ncbi:MAG TPA: hypothetical protein VK498_13820 [Ferruginibacter sp.]|nr:hypothetical protein [Ferruginibacter sp.]
MKKAILFVIMFVSVNVYAQPVLSKKAIKDFAAACWLNYRYGENKMFFYTMNTYLPYRSPDVALLMERLDTDTKGREEVFKVFYRVAVNYETLFTYFYGLQIGAIQSKELANYIMVKYGSPEIVWSHKSKIFFEGTKTFVDSANYWKYVFTINDINVTLESYPGDNNTKYENKKQRISIIKAYINGDKIVDITNSPTVYKYERGALYEKNDEGGWNEYIESKN